MLFSWLFLKNNGKAIVNVLKKVYLVNAVGNKSHKIAFLIKAYIISAVRDLKEVKDLAHIFQPPLFKKSRILLICRH